MGLPETGQSRMAAVGRRERSFASRQSGIRPRPALHAPDRRLGEDGGKIVSRVGRRDRSDDSVSSGFRCETDWNREVSVNNGRSTVTRIRRGVVSSRSIRPATRARHTRRKCIELDLENPGEADEEQIDRNRVPQMTSPTRRHSGRAIQFARARCASWRRASRAATPRVRASAISDSDKRTGAPQ